MQCSEIGKSRRDTTPKVGVAKVHHMLSETYCVQIINHLKMKTTTTTTHPKAAHERCNQRSDLDNRFFQVLDLTGKDRLSDRPAEASIGGEKRCGSRGRHGSKGTVQCGAGQ